MDAAVSEHSLLDRIAEFLKPRPPTLDEILGPVCETYRTNPDDLETMKGRFTRAMFCFLASHLASETTQQIGARVALPEIDVHRAVFSINSRARCDELIRDDLDLICVRIAERVLLRERWR